MSDPHGRGFWEAAVPPAWALRALAKGLQVPEDEIFSIARGKSLEGPDAREELLLDLFRSLTAEHQDILMSLLQHLHKEYGIKKERAEAMTKKRTRRAA